MTAKIRSLNLESQGAAQRNDEQAKYHGGKSYEAKEFGRLFRQFEQDERHTLGEQKIGNPLEDEGKPDSDDEERPVNVHAAKDSREQRLCPPERETGEYI